MATGKVLNLCRPEFSQLQNTEHGLDDLCLTNVDFILEFYYSPFLVIFIQFYDESILFSPYM